MLPLQGAWVWSLVGELRSRKPCCVAKKKKKGQRANGHRPKDKTCSETCSDVEKCGKPGESLHRNGKIKHNEVASLVVQWLRIRLLMQETQRRALVREDPTCRGATKPVRHNYWACALEPFSHSYWSPRTWSPCSTTREATAMRSPRTTMRSSPRSPQLEKARAQQWRPNTAKN